MLLQVGGFFYLGKTRKAVRFPSPGGLSIEDYCSVISPAGPIGPATRVAG